MHHVTFYMHFLDIFFSDIEKHLLVGGFHHISGHKYYCNKKSCKKGIEISPLLFLLLSLIIQFMLFFISSFYYNFNSYLLKPPTRRWFSTTRFNKIKKYIIIAFQNMVVVSKSSKWKVLSLLNLTQLLFKYIILSN